MKQYYKMQFACIIIIKIQMRWLTGWLVISSPYMAKLNQAHKWLAEKNLKYVGELDKET